VCTYKSIRGTDREADTKTARGERSTSVRAVDTMASMSRTKRSSLSDEMKKFMISAADGSHELPDRDTSARIVSCWRFGGTGVKSTKGLW